MNFETVKPKIYDFTHLTVKEMSDEICHLKAINKTGDDYYKQLLDEYIDIIGSHIK